MSNLSHLVIIDDVIEKHLLLGDIINEPPNAPISILEAWNDLDDSMRQFGRYREIREQLIEEGVIL